MTVGLLLATVCGSGCAPFARVDLTQPCGDQRQRLLPLESEWAHFASEDSPWDRLLLAWPLPGARSGNKHFVLYLRLPRGAGRYSVEEDDDQHNDL
ncbi:MAG: hypothetical protein ACYSUI_14050, partial [Planctomycetota bacterium]